MFHKSTIILIVFALPVSACDTIQSPEPNAGQISGQVWVDLNENGIQEAGDFGLYEVEVQVLAEDGKLVDKEFTDEQGRYYFSDLAIAKNYRIRVIPAEEYLITVMDVGLEDTVDSDVEARGTRAGQSKLITDMDERISVIDAGLIGGPDIGLPPELGLEEMVTIQGFVWLDANGDGLYEAGEALLPDVEVSLLSTEALLTVLESVKTDVVGNFSFSPRAASDTYRLFYFNPTAYVFTQKDQGADDMFDSDAWEAGEFLGHTDVFDLAQGAPPDLAAGLVFDMFTPVSSSADVEAHFTVSSLPCGDMGSDFTIPYHMELVDDILTMTSDFEGSIANGNIDRDGQFYLEDINGRETFEGQFGIDWAGIATNLYKDDGGCVTPYEIVFTPLEN